mgnify:CR=1 FL=1
MHNKYYIFYGGGRWGKIVLAELSGISEYPIYWVTQYHNDLNQEWLLQNNYTNIEIFGDLSKHEILESSGVFLVNSTQERIKFLESDLSNSIDVFAEKPIAWCAKHAVETKLKFAKNQSLLYLNLEYFFDLNLKKFQSLIRNLTIKRVDLIWEDAHFIKLNEGFKFPDFDTPQILDHFPHIWSILNSIGLQLDETKLTETLYMDDNTIKIALINDQCEINLILSRRRTSRKRLVSINQRYEIELLSDSISLKDCKSGVIETHKNINGNVRQSLQSFIKSTHDRKNRIHSLDNQMQMLNLAHHIQDSIDLKIMQILKKYKEEIRPSCCNQFLLNACEDRFRPYYQHKETDKFDMNIQEHKRKFLRFIKKYIE